MITNKHNKAKIIKKNQNTKKIKIKRLKNQINPHFFFNTLNNLYGLVVEKSESAPGVVLKLSDMMRYTIYEGKEDLVNLSDEVQYLERYIALHKIRYQKTVDIQFDYAIDEEVQVAPLLFIILLENAFKHGVESLTEDAFIHMHLKTKDDKVFFSITNNFDVEASPQVPGIGLEILKKRLRHMYADRHALTLEKSGNNYTAKLELALNPVTAQ